MKACLAVLALQCFFTFILTGLIWVLQVVHYPLFSLVERHKFPTYEKKHQRRISSLLFPLMVLECFFAVLLFTVGKTGGFKTASLILFAILLVIWVSTFCLQIPTLAELSHGWSMKSARRLVLTNWIRTVGWSLRSLILLWLLLKI